jgi:hypothetical protein
MATDKFTIASAALVSVGANSVTSFNNSASSTAEQVAAFYMYPTTVENWLSLYPWRFATKTIVLSRDVTPPASKWLASYTAPSDMLSLQAVTDERGNPIEYDRSENKILCNVSETESIYAVYTWIPAESQWPGYFVKLIEYSLGQQFANSLAAKLDMAKRFEDMAEKQFRLAKNTDARQQTTKKLPVAGRRSILEARRS